MSNFTLAILEFTDEISVIYREQKYINRFKPEYNLNPLARNSKGYKHTPESIEKMRKAALGSKHKDEIRKLMSENRKKERK
jgi:group I intron endonuclease